MLFADGDGIVVEMRLVRFALVMAAGLLAISASPSLGPFESSSDVGEVLHPGSAEYDAALKTYTLTGSGENMWFAKDDFHFMWKKVSAKDISLAADIDLLGEGGDNHRKAVLMIRQSLDTDAAYADAARHGDGLTSLQFRDEKGATTHEVESNVSGPKRLRIEKHGDLFYLWVGDSDQNMHFAGGSTRVKLKSPFYVGIGVCAHNKDAVQKAMFSDVDLSTKAMGAHAHYSTLETVAVASTDARVTYVSEQVLSAPSWSQDGAFLTFRAGGQTQRVAVTGDSPEAFTGDASNENASPRTSPDGKETASLSKANGQMLVSVSASAGGENPKTIAKLATGGQISAKPWSPDGKRLAFVSYQRP